MPLSGGGGRVAGAGTGAGTGTGAGRERDEYGIGGRIGDTAPQRRVNFIAANEQSTWSPSSELRCV